ncbi:SDR family NAD(P)-dependent oxidoreductase (plasmid) [Rhodococcus sp. NBC_00297]
MSGAGRGIGRSHALLLAELHAHVVVNDLGVDREGRGVDRVPAESVVAEIVAAGGSASANHSDVSSAEGAAELVEGAVQMFGGIDILINNAGVLTGHDFPFTPVDDLRRNLDVHLVGAFELTRAAWPHLRMSDAGRVVMTSSSGLFGDLDLIAYGSAKAGVVGLAAGLAAVGARDGVGVNTIAPIANTRMSDPDPVFDSFTPRDVSAVVAYLAHSDCQLNGVTLAAGGGRVARIAIGESAGHVQQDLTIEDVADNIDTICDTGELFVPNDMAGYFRAFLGRVSDRKRLP